ncbi:MAG: hypothetical protein BWY31_01566 [Lentisphaerae bacterium ADurb.Bin242]|nr:MAG: hypothetical protein BWY31_01566 [Lentisphaerae bacterium ADurb.Bin242]
MTDPFFTKKNCDRCGKPFDGARTMSRFNTDCICMRCAEDERNHPDYRKATDAELNAVRHGDRNFPGVGWPGKNGKVK